MDIYYIFIDKTGKMGQKIWILKKVLNLIYEAHKRERERGTQKNATKERDIPWH